LSNCAEVLSHSITEIERVCPKLVKGVYSGRNRGMLNTYGQELFEAITDNPKLRQ